MKLPTDPLELAILLGRRLDGAAGYLSTLEAYYEGQQSASFMSAASLEAMAGQLPHLEINICRLAVLSLVERLRLVGFKLDGAPEADPDVWESWTRSGGDLMSDCAHVDSLALRRSYVLVWVDEYGDPLISAESPSQATSINDPTTGHALVGLKKWADVSDPDQGTGQGHAVLYLPDRVISYETDMDLPLQGLPQLGGAWRMVENLPNPAGVCPVVPLINSYGNRTLDRIEGESEMTDVMPIADAIAKMCQDLMLASETTARQRRWAVGLELVPRRDPDTGEQMVDDTGEPLWVNPFSSDALRLWQSESAETKFGAFPTPDLSPYSNSIRTLLEGASAVSTLPSHYLGAFREAPPSADALRAAESSLTSRASGKVRMFTPAWSRVAQLEVALRTGRDVRSISVEPMWASVETRTPSQSADEAVKLTGMGVPVETVLSRVLGWTPEEVASVHAYVLEAAAMKAKAAANLAAAGYVNPPANPPGQDTPPPPPIGQGTST